MKDRRATTQSECSAVSGAPTRSAGQFNMIGREDRIILNKLQAMLKNLFDHFKVLYQDISEKNPHLVSEHALRQEEEVYNKSYKLTYRNVRCQSLRT